MNLGHYIETCSRDELLVTARLIVSELDTRRRQNRIHLDLHETLGIRFCSRKNCPERISAEEKT